MKYDHKRHLNLLTDCLEFEKLNKDFFDENPEDWVEFQNYQSLVLDQIFWTQRKKFLELIFDFITAKIDYDEFESGFLLVFHPTHEEAFTLGKDISYIEKFEYIPASEEFGSYMVIIFRLLDDVDDEYRTKEDVRNYLMQLFLKFQN